MNFILNFMNNLSVLHTSRQGKVQVAYTQKLWSMTSFVMKQWGWWCVK